MSSQVRQKIESLAVECITPGPRQARAAFDPESLRELADSIRESGLVQPLVVRPAQDGYELLAGERRWRACQMAGLAEVPAMIRDDIDDAQASVIGLIENLQRESLLPVETARGLAGLIDELGLTHAEAGERIGKSRVYVTNYLRLLELAEPARMLVDAGRLSLGHAKVLAGVPAIRQGRLAHKAVRWGWSVRRLEKECRNGKATGQREAGHRNSAHARLESGLSDYLGNPVSIRYSGRDHSGEMRIRFHDLDEFEGLLERLGWSDGDPYQGG